MTVTQPLVAGRYRIDSCLGMGGMGRVWLARDEVLRRDVAIKEIALPFGLTDEEREEMRERTLREARAAARLNHPNVVRIYDVQHGEERPWIVMEYVPSRSLLQVIKENGPLPADQVAGIGLALLSALDAAYRVGVLHRDIKPSNVLIAHDRRVLLTDFGSAVMDEGEGALTRTGIIVGSPRYIAPERAHNGTSTLESDLWSLGATLYEAVEGRTPYTRETTMATLIALATERPDPTQLAGPLKPVLHGLLQKKPQARMRLAEVQEHLRRIADVESAVTLRRMPAPAHGAQAEPGHALALVPGQRWGAQEPTPAESFTPPAARPPAHPEDAYLVPQATPSRPRRYRRWQLVAVAGTAVAAVMGGATAYGLSNREVPWSRDAQVAAGSGGAFEAAAQPDASTSAPDTPSVPATLPTGYSWYTSKSGFKLPWPAKWTKVAGDRSSVTLCAPGGPPLVGARDWTPSDPDLRMALIREETAAALPTYERLRIEVSAQGDRAEWEYTFTDPKMGRLHGLERAVVAGGRSYLLQFRAPAEKWTQTSSVRQVVLDTFRSAATVTAAPDALPSGFVWYRNPVGFQVPRPARWTKVAEMSTATQIAYCAPGGPPLMIVGPWQPSASDLATALREAERRAGLASYKLVSMEVLEDDAGAVWEFTYTDPKMGRVHALDRIVVAGNGVYRIQWRTPLNKWAVNLPVLGVVTGRFSA